MPSTSNPLVTATKTTDSSLRPNLHPLALLTVSDYITRQVSRRQTSPIAGVLLGQQNGREVSIEHAYELRLEPTNDEEGGWKLHDAFFDERLQQYKDVHKEPPLDLVGWWTISPPEGPGHQVLQIHKSITSKHNESALLLAFHPSAVTDGSTSDGRLPITIYETVYDTSSGVEQDGDRVMDGADSKGSGTTVAEIRFRELGYELATGEAEMIAVDFVAKGGGNATAVIEGGKQSSRGTAESAKGKGKEVVADESDANEIAEGDGLTAEEEELIASLTTRANAIRMLHSRVSLLKEYLNALPPSYLTTTHATQDTSDTAANTSTSQANISHPILRSILALTARLTLLIPPNDQAFDQQALAERSDVALVELLGGVSQSVKSIKDMGQRFALIEQAAKSKGNRMMIGSMMNDDYAAGGGGGGGFASQDMSGFGPGY